MQSAHISPRNVRSLFALSARPVFGWLPMDADNLPIDIHCGKLLDWLISRRHCKKEWQDAAFAIRERINHAMEDMPEHPEIRQLLSGTYLHYFNCQRIVEIMKETEKDSKNFLGFYSSQRMKDWQEVCKAYEKDNVYLAEAAQLLQRLVQYEVPGLRKQIARTHQIVDVTPAVHLRRQDGVKETMLEECGRKQEDLEKSAREADKAFERECEKMGLQPKASQSLRSQLLTLAEGTTEFLNEIASQTSSLDKAVEYYTAFRQYLLSKEGAEENLLPMLGFVRQKGNPTYYEWKHGRAPNQVHHIRLDDEPDPQSDEQEIDFGDGDIDFGGEENGIDFGDISVEDFAGSGIELGSGSASQLVSAEEIGDDGEAKGKEALSVLENAETQELFMRDLKELRSFLRFRLSDLGSEGTAELLLASQASLYARPPLADLTQPQAFSPKTRPVFAIRKQLVQVEKLLAGVEKIVEAMEDRNRQHLLAIRASPLYLDRLVSELDTKRNAARRFLSQASASKQRVPWRALFIHLKIQMRTNIVWLRAGEASETGQELAPKLTLLISRTKELQKEVEQDISKRYNNRKVNIMGTLMK